MRATELIGKMAVRTQPIYETVVSGYGGIFMGPRVEQKPTYAFTTSPIKILKATEGHIVYEAKNIVGETKSTALLDCRYCDDNWADYDELMKIE